MAPGGSGGRDPGGDPGNGTAAGPVRLSAWVSGRVQGVGFRWWVRSQARELGLTGVAENLQDGRVRVVAEGPPAECAELLGRLSGPDGPGRVSGVAHRWGPAAGAFSGFAER